MTGDTRQDVEESLRKAFYAGFARSAEGFNGEYGESEEGLRNAWQRWLASDAGRKVISQAQEGAPNA